MSHAAADKPRILVVDDDPAIVNVLHVLLRKEFQVMVATSGEQALHVVETRAPELILLDVNMPGMGGYGLCRVLKTKESTRAIPIIFVTGNGDENDEAEGFGG